jgi:hypothetical protein
MFEAIKSWKGVVIVSVLCICVAAIVVAWMLNRRQPHDRYRLQKITEKGKDILWRLDTETGETQVLNPGPPSPAQIEYDQMMGTYNSSPKPAGNKN